MFSTRTQGCSERVFRRLESIASHELESLVVKIGTGFSPMWCSAWGHLFRALAVLQPSSRRLSIIVQPFERSMAEKFKKGETLSRFLGVGIGKHSDVA